MVASRIFRLASLAALLLASPVVAQLNESDRSRDPVYQHPAYQTPAGSTAADTSAPAYERVDPGSQDPKAPPPGDQAPPPESAPAQAGTKEGIPQKDVVAAAEDVFGKGAKGLAGLIEKIMKDQGEPTAYIAGREASGAFVVGARY